jgi:assimilatory nitrate reductase catalytic subunit
MAEVCTTCPYCGVGCGLILSETRDGWAVGGDPDHPANKGRICSKGANLTQTLGDQGRLLTPRVDGQETAWPQAIAAVAKRMEQTIAQHGPKSVAFYVSGQLLTEDYYVANKFLKGFVGSPHIDTNSRLCMASTVVGHKRAFGADVVPGSYEDLELADLVILVGSNLAWCHPVLNQRLLAAQKRRGTRLIVIDPRRTASCDSADLHLPLAPGSDVALFNGLLAHLARQDALDHAYLAAHVSGTQDALALATQESPSIEATAARCGLSAEAVSAFFEAFTQTEKVVTIFSQGVNQSSQGSDKVNAILNCHLATGRVGKPGSTPFSVTGQPNAMGGREVGGLANQLAAHLNPNDASDVDLVRRFWDSPALGVGEGYKAVDLFDAIDRGEIKFLWVMATNPAVSLPNSDRVRRALTRCPTVVVSDVISQNDTLAYAHIALPAAAWGEKDGTVTNSERRISRQRPFLPLPGEARPDWWIISAVAQEMGFGKAFSYRSPAAIFREHAALSGFENQGLRAFDISGLQKISDKGYHALEPVQWPLRSLKEGGTERLYGDGQFTHRNGKARMLAVSAQCPQQRPSIALPLVLNSGRYRDQWHTMTRTGRSARLSAHRPEPLLEINPTDAQAHQLSDGALATISNPQGAVLCRVAVTDAQAPGQVFLPIHWNDSLASQALVSRLMAAHTDPLSGQPESKYAPVAVAPYRATWSGLLLIRGEQPDLSPVPYWCRQSADGCAMIELAGHSPEQWEVLHGQFDLNSDLERLDYQDRTRGIRRSAWLRDGKLEACLFIAPQRPDLARSWLADLFAAPTLEAANRAVLLAGQAPSGNQDQGRLVCSCFSVGLNTIKAALAEGKATSVDDIGRLLRAGTGCGSCVSELKEIVAHGKPAAAA